MENNKRRAEIQENVQLRQGAIHQNQIQDECFDIKYHLCQHLESIYKVNYNA